MTSEGYQPEGDRISTSMNTHSTQLWSSSKDTIIPTKTKIAYTILKRLRIWLYFSVASSPQGHIIRACWKECQRIIGLIKYSDFLPLPLTCSRWEFYSIPIEKSFQTSWFAIPILIISRKGNQLLRLIYRAHCFFLESGSTERLCDHGIPSCLHLPPQLWSSPLPKSPWEVKIGFLGPIQTLSWDWIQYPADWLPGPKMH